MSEAPPSRASTPSPGTAPSGAATSAPSGPALAWRVLDTGAASGAWNMALDHALAEEGRDGVAVLRFYAWERPTVSLGRNEPARDRWDVAAARARGIDFVRRPTGGRAVLHHRELTYAVVLPLRALGGPREAYARINRALLRGLAGLGAPVSLAGGGEPSLPPSAGPCFRAPASGEVTVSGRKLVGSAQARLGRSLLQHGSLLLADDQARLGPLGRRAGGEVRGRAPATLEAALGRIPSWPELTTALLGGVEGELGARWTRDVPTEEEWAAAERLLERYGSPEWTWRR